MIENYLTILEDSLKKKLVVLDEITEHNKEFSLLLSKGDLTAEQIDAMMEKKELLTNRLERLDEGFESLYERIREQLLSGMDLYKSQISRLQTLVRQVTEKGVAIQAQEERNRRLLDGYFQAQHRLIKQSRQSSQMAYGYYKSMNNGVVMSPQFMDQKK